LTKEAGKCIIALNALTRYHSIVLNYLFPDTRTAHPT
jgi:hypothetical protein